MRINKLLGVGAAVLLTAAVGTACSSPAETADESSGGTRTVTDATGTKVTVPDKPERVIALSEQDLDSALALDVTPVGTVNGRGQKAPPAYLGDDAAAIEVVGDVGKPTTDKIVELEPDLVLYGGASDEEQLEQLRELVPATVVTYKLDDDWKTAFEATADALNKTEAASSWLSEYDDTVTEAADSLGDNASAKISIVRWNPEGPGILQHEAFSSLVIQDLGLERPKDQQDPGFAHTDPLSLENLPRIDGDWLFVGTLVPGSEEALSEAQDDPAFSQLDAVKNDHFVEIDGTLWTSRGGPLGALKVVEDVVSNLGK
jgi:iron complex transport system substrate-binding protein